MAFDVKEVLVNFRSLVKNRQGPYSIVLRNKDGLYLSSYNKWVDPLRNSFHHYDKYWELLAFIRDYNKECEHGGEFHLTSAAGDILLKESDFKQ